jgi:hypothetical protein
MLSALHVNKIIAGVGDEIGRNIDRGEPAMRPDSHVNEKSSLTQSIWPG